MRVPVADEPLKVHLFVATLGYSRRTFVAMFLHERQSAWLQGLEGAFRHFGGTPQEVLVDNARALVSEHDLQTREVRFNDRFHAFCRYWKVTPRACAPYRAQTKGKDERRLRVTRAHLRVDEKNIIWASENLIRTKASFSEFGVTQGFPLHSLKLPEMVHVVRK
ncbi:transposase [Variovorax sp. OAS795]